MKKELSLNIRMEKSLKENFDKHCKKNGYSVSKRLRIIIENDINKCLKE